MSRQLINMQLAVNRVGGLKQICQFRIGSTGSKKFSLIPSLSSLSRSGDSVPNCVQKRMEMKYEINSQYMSCFSGSRFIYTSCGGSSSGILYSDYEGPTDVDYSLSHRRPASLSRKHENPYSQKLLSARTSEEILTVLETDADQLDALSLSVAVDALFDMLKNESSLSTKAKHQLLTTVGMQKLCKQLRRLSPHMDPGDIINGVKLLSYLSAPGTHQTLQILLKLLSKHANLMDLQQLAYMQFLLDKLDPESKSPLSKALEFALPVVFESKLQTELDRSDYQAVCDYLHYASRYKLSDKTINLLVEAALRLMDRLSPVAAKSIVWSLCDTRHEHPSHEPLLTFCFKKLSESIHSFKLLELTTTFNKAARKYSKRVPYFYNESFVDAYCNRLMHSDVNPSEIVWSIKSVSVVRHLNIEYVDRVGEIIASNPTLILNHDFLFMSLVKAISNLNYKPEKWSSFSSILLEHPALTKNFGQSEVSLTFDFLALDMFPENMIRTLYSADGLQLLEEYQAKHPPICLLLLYNSIKVLYPDYKGPLPPKSMIENWKELARASNANKQYPLKAALQSGLGGGSYVITGLYHEGLHIDHGIVMRKGGYPVAVNSQSDSQSDCLSSITKPPESVIVLIKVFTPDLYLSNTRRLRGLPALELKILEALGHPIVPLDLEQWKELPDHEKIPYLMQKIREKMEPLQWNKNWGDVIPP